MSRTILVRGHALTPPQARAMSHLAAAGSLYLCPGRRRYEVYRKTAHVLVRLGFAEWTDAAKLTLAIVPEVPHVP